VNPLILIVEDEQAIADTIQYALETDGCRTLHLAEGQPVAATLHSNPVDLIILDIGLPDINGFELCKQIREHSPVPIIFLTARADEVDRVVGLEIGGDDYVTKPFSPREVAARVKAVLRRTSGRVPAPEQPANGPFQLDEERRQIRFQNKDLVLSRYEYEILRLLLLRPGRVFSRQQIMDLVWEEPETSMERTVDAHIRNLRAKLKKVAPQQDPIITHRGVGYSLQEEP
jgi:two-component system catabolic regulation response regulator CreB